MIRWLGIHYKFPPVATVSSRRLFLLYQALEELTEELAVVTSAETAQRPQEQAYQHDWELEKVTGRGIREYLYGNGRNTVPNEHKQRPGYSAAVRLRETFPFQYYLGEGGPVYRHKAFQAASKIIEERGITHLFSSFRPWTDHLVAARLKARFPHLYWIADFRDLPIDPLRNPPYGLEWHRTLLRKRLQAVDEVWTVSQGLAKNLSKYHAKVAVVPGGVTKLPSATDYQGAQFRINYSGSIYPGLQKIAPLMDALSLLTEQGLIEPEKISLHYAGKDELIFRAWLDAYDLPIGHLLEGQLPLAAALERQRQCHLNLLLSWSAVDYQGILTAKLYDYLAAGRPVLALINGPDDPELRAIIENSESGRVFACEPPGEDHERQGKRSQSRGVRKFNQETTARSWEGRPAEVQKIADYLLEQYQTWMENKGRLPWQAKADQLVSLQPLPILRRLLFDNKKTTHS